MARPVERVADVPKECRDNALYVGAFGYGRAQAEACAAYLTKTHGGDHYIEAKTVNHGDGFPQRVPMIYYWVRHRGK